MTPDKKHQLLMELAKTLDAPDMEPDTALATAGKEPWDSIAVVTTIASIDDLFGFFVEGKRLQACRIAGDVLNLVEEKLR